MAQPRKSQAWLGVVAQALDPDGEKNPSAHELAHSAAPANEYSPEMQPVHDDMPVFENFPAAHKTQLVAPNSVM